MIVLYQDSAIDWLRVYYFYYFHVYLVQISERIFLVFIEVETAMAQINDTSDRHYSKRILKRLNILKTMLKRSLQAFSMDDSEVPTALPHPETTSMYYFMLVFSSNLKIITLLA